MVIRESGHLKPEEMMALRTRSFDSRTVLSAMPTTFTAGSPGVRWTSIQIGGASSPSCARDATLANRIRRPCLAVINVVQVFVVPMSHG